MRHIISLVIFICAISVFAQNAPTTPTQVNPGTTNPVNSIPATTNPTMANPANNTNMNPYINSTVNPNGVANPNARQGLATTTPQVAPPQYPAPRVTEQPIRSTDPRVGTMNWPTTTPTTTPR